MEISRAMEEDDGHPLLGSTATKLGIRKGKDIEVDEDGAVHRPEFLPGEPNGLSCASTIDSLPSFALPVSQGGTHKKTVVWRIDSDHLPPALIAEHDDDTHISIGPEKTMAYNEFVDAIDSTASHWRRVD